MEHFLFHLENLTPEQKEQIMKIHTRTVNFNAIIWAAIGTIIGLLIG